MGTLQESLARHQRTGAAARSLPWLLPLVAAVLGLWSIEVPLGSIARYGAYFGLCVALPGVLVLRALGRSTGNWAEDVGLGSVVGSACQLAGWAVFTALGWQSWLLVWPALLVAGFALVPSLRRHWRIAEPEPLPTAWTWGLATAATVLVCATIFGTMAYHPAPPAGVAYHPDLMYHLSMVNELVRSVPPQLPQVSGELLDYHWFANAHMAGAVDITRLSPIVVLYRLWLLPMAVVALLVCAALARTVSRVWWTGLIPAVVLVGPQLGLFRRSAADLVPPLSLLSPSQTLGMLAATTAAVFLIELLFRDPSRKGLWVLAVAVALVGGGSKPTVLPILLGAVGLSALYLLIRDRSWPRRSIVAGVVLLVATVGTMLTVAGSTSGSGIQLLAIVKLQAGYRAATGDETLAAAGGWILPALSSGDFLAVMGALAVFATVLVTQVVVLGGSGLLAARTARQDPVGWFLVGGMVAGWAGYLLVDHPSASESYFIRTAVPFGAAALGWLLALSARGLDRRSKLLVAGAGSMLGATFALVLAGLRTVPRGSRAQAGWAVARPLAGIAVLAAVLVVAWLLVIRPRWRRRGVGVALAVLTVITLPSALVVERNLPFRSARQSGTFSSPEWEIHPDEMAAAGWLTENSPPGDVVATNTFCRPAGPPVPGCDPRGYVVSGIAGRRALIEGWAYTQEGMANQGVNGKKYTAQPSPWPDRVAITEQAIGAPTPEVIARLRDRYGVRWIFADGRNGPVSPRLADLAVLRHTDGQVRIYELTR